MVTVAWNAGLRPQSEVSDVERTHSSVGPRTWTATLQYSVPFHLDNEVTYISFFLGLYGKSGVQSAMSTHHTPLCLLQYTPLPLVTWNKEFERCRLSILFEIFIFVHCNPLDTILYNTAQLSISYSAKQFHLVGNWNHYIFIKVTQWPRIHFILKINGH